MSIRIGAIGAGGIIHHHLVRLKEMKDVHIAAIMDVDEDRARVRAGLFGAKAYGRIEKMLEEEELDAVYIGVIPSAHGKPEALCISAGIPMFIEKPIARELATAQRILDSIRRKKLIVSVGYHMRYWDTVARAKEYVAKRKVALVRGAWIGGIPGAPWWGRKKDSGGQHHEQATHIFDMARYLFGEVESVAAYGYRGIVPQTADYDVEDASAALLHFKSGAVGTIFSSDVATRSEEVGLSAICENAMVEMKWGNLTIREKETTCEYLPTVDPYVLESRAFIDAIKTGKPGAIRSDYADAFETLKLTLSVDKAMKTGKTVQVGGAK